MNISAKNAARIKIKYIFAICEIKREICVSFLTSTLGHLVKRMFIASNLNSY
jgi:hypothetical protein